MCKAGLSVFSNRHPHQPDLLSNPTGLFIRDFALHWLGQGLGLVDHSHSLDGGLHLQNHRFGRKAHRKPFSTFYYGLPLYAISRTIRSNLLDRIDQERRPVHGPVDGVLM